MHRLSAALLLVLLIALAPTGCARPATGFATTTRPYAAGDGVLNLLILGDWGTGKPAQKVVADAVVKYIKDTGTKFDACLSPGDNMYVNLTGVNDYQWVSLFEQMYDPTVMNFPFYCTFGNHDYEGDKRRVQLQYAKQNPNSRFKFPSNWYRLTLPAEGEKPIASIYMVDSCFDEMPRAMWETQKTWLAIEAKGEKRAPWVIWLAHHPPFSNGKNGDALHVQADWKSIINDSKADFYIAGHEHSLQHLEIPGWPSIIISGAGGQRLNAMRRNDRGPFSRSTYGFVHLSLTRDYAEARIINSNNELLHLFTRDHDGKVKVWSTSASDPKTIGWFRSMFGN